jgi:FKBP-type peptidyl-prolyl cis-trans isomerase
MHKGTWLALAVAAGVVGVAVVAQDRPAPSQDSAWLNKQMLAIASLKPADGWQPLPGGGRWRRIAGPGTGKHPTAADTVTINYEGKLIDGTKFDSSWDRGEPATFPLDALIEGWQIAVPKAGVGDTIEIALPADLAYGPEGKGEIPGGATLMFKIELLGIQ